MPAGVSVVSRGSGSDAPPGLKVSEEAGLPPLVRPTSSRHARDMKHRLPRQNPSNCVQWSSKAESYEAASGPSEERDPLAELRSLATRRPDPYWLGNERARRLEP